MPPHVPKRLLILLVCASTLTVAMRASGNADIVAVVYEPPSALLVPLTAELRLAGFEPIPVEAPPGTETTATLRDIAEQVNAAATVRILSADRGVVVFILDKSSDVVVSSEITAAKSVERAETVIALKTVEILRADLMDLKKDSLPQADTTSPPNASPPKPPAPPKNAGHTKTIAVKASSTPRGRFYLAPSASFGFGGLPPALHVALDLSVRAFGRLHLHLSGLAPTLRTSIKSSDGSAAVRDGIVSMGATIDLGSPKHIAMPFVGVFGGALFFDVEGEAARPFIGKNKTKISGELHLAAGARFRLNRIVALRCDLALGLVVPRPVVRFDGRAVAAYGRPLLFGALGVDVVVF